jgi:hypothetical protein
VLVSPTYIDPKLTGTYFLESSLDFDPDAMDGKAKFGVMLHPLEEVLAEMKEQSARAYLRKLSGVTVDGALQEKIRRAYEESRSVPYDLFVSDWIRVKEASEDVSVEHFAELHNLSPEQRQGTRSMWCSAFAGFFFVRLGLLRSDTPWSLLSPRSWGSSRQDLSFVDGVSLEPERTVPL